MPKKEIVIIGSGVSGLLCGKRLTEAGHSVLLIDKGRNAGGRLSTRRTDGAVFHHGASSLPDFYKHKDFPEFGLKTLKRAEREKVIQRKGDLFEPVSSVSHLVSFFAKSLNIQEGCEATSLNLKNKTIDVTYRNGTHKKLSYDILIISIPPNQAKTLINNQLDRFDNCLGEVEMRSSAAALFSFDLDPELIRETHLSNKNVNIYIENNRFKCAQRLLCLTVHTNEPFARKVVNNDKNRIKEILLKEVSSAVPISLPKPNYEAGHRWLYGFTERALGKPYLFYKKESVGICGDWCSGSSILDAASSGVKLAEHILKPFLIQG